MCSTNALAALPLSELYNPYIYVWRCANVFFQYGLCTCCVACMIFAHDVSVKCAIALLFMSKNMKMQQNKSIVTRVRGSHPPRTCLVLTTCNQSCK